MAPDIKAMRTRGNRIIQKMVFSLLPSLEKLKISSRVKNFIPIRGDSINTRRVAQQYKAASSSITWACCWALSVTARPRKFKVPCWITTYSPVPAPTPACCACCHRSYFNQNT